MSSGERMSTGRQWTWGALALLVGMVVLSIIPTTVKAETPLAQIQMSPMRQDSINKIPSAPEVPRMPSTDIAASPPGPAEQDSAQVSLLNSTTGSRYDPAGRRDPFLPILEELRGGKIDESLPPLQRVALTEIDLIAIVWGPYGYVAMVQTPEGHGYTVKRGTKIGQNNGIVRAVTERGIIVEERFTDLYGMKQEREHVKLLHPKEGSE